MIDATFLSPLYDVLTVARRGSVAAAADALSKTPSAVSQQIRRVESHFGVALFERSGRGVRLSAAGEALVAPATRLFDEAESVLGLLAELGETAPVRLRLAVSDYLGKDLLAPVMREVAAEELPLRFEIITAHSAESVRLLERGEVDLAIVTSPDTHPNLVERELFRQPLLWVAPRDESGSGGDIESRLATQPLLRLAPRSVGRRLLDEYLAQHGIRPVSTIDVPSVSLLLAYVEAGVGVGLAPALSLRELTDTMDTQAARIQALPVKLVTRQGFGVREPVQKFVARLAETGQAIQRELGNR
ncbi:MAG: DNA-binding transcriptional LysR family regulator [Hyphomicrobiaceae bacterium]|jgi:DNA-binding transcriptional LysR family regulator